MWLQIQLYTLLDNYSRLETNSFSLLNAAHSALLIIGLLEGSSTDEKR